MGVNGKTGKAYLWCPHVFNLDSVGHSDVSTTHPPSKCFEPINLPEVQRIDLQYCPNCLVCPVILRFKMRWYTTQSLNASREEGLELGP